MNVGCYDWDNTSLHNVKCMSVHIWFPNEMNVSIKPVICSFHALLISRSQDDCHFTRIYQKQSKICLSSAVPNLRFRFYIFAAKSPISLSFTNVYTPRLFQLSPSVQEKNFLNAAFSLAALALALVLTEANSLVTMASLGANLLASSRSLTAASSSLARTYARPLR